jgi:hypothetical protein
MAQWGKTDAAADSPFMTAQQLKEKANTANRDALYGNTTSTAGVFAVDAAEQAAGADVAHTGWILRRLGTGPIVSIAISTAGSGYANGETFTVAAPGAGANATGTLTTDASGAITDATLVDAGSGFVTVNPTVAITTAAGTGGALTATAGGRAGRTQTEVLAAIGITTDGSDDAVYPDV